VIGIRLGLQIRKPHDKHGNTNGESPKSGIWGGAQYFGMTEPATVSPKVCAPGSYQGNGDVMAPD
jgi:hypothetical protein